MDARLVSLLRRMKLVPEKARQRRRSGPGAHLSKGLGQSMDFSELRPYQPGDDLRALDWKLYGRTDRLYTKLYVPEQEETVCFLLDTSASMEEKWEAARTVVLGLASVALGQGDRVALLPLANQALPDLRGLAPARGRSALARVSRLLNRMKPAGRIDLEAAFEEASKRLRARCHLVVVSDFLQPGAGLKGLQKLRYRRHRLSLLQLLSPQERDPRLSLTPGEWELLDFETGEETPTGVRVDIGRSGFSRYMERLAEHEAAIRAFSRSAGAVFVSGDANLDPVSFFSEDLRKAGLLA